MRKDGVLLMTWCLAKTSIRVVRSDVRLVTRCLTETTIRVVRSDVSLVTRCLENTTMRVVVSAPNYLVPSEDCQEVKKCLSDSDDIQL